jgi:predicted Rossmann-fold nucleotide-binding protein
MPIILVCSDFWRGLLDWFQQVLINEGYISPEDMNLIQIIDEPAQIVDAIFQHYETSGFEPTPAEREIQLNL